MGLLGNPLAWVDSVGDKVGRLLGDKTPSFRSHKHMPLPTQDPVEEEIDTGEENVKQKRDHNRGHRSEDCRHEDLDFQGPDTSSLSAFLRNLLSCSEAGIRCGDDVASSSGDNMKARGRPSHVHASSPSNQVVKVQGLAKGSTLGEENVREDMKMVGRTTGDYEDETDWQLVDKHDLFHPRMLGGVSDQAGVTLGSHDLPAMSDESSLMSETLCGFLHSALPTLAKGRQWVLLYSTQKHGMSLLTLYRRSAMLPGPCLLGHWGYHGTGHQHTFYRRNSLNVPVPVSIVQHAPQFCLHFSRVAGDRQGAVFGGLMNAPLQPSPKKKYQGTSESFVFTNVTGHPYIFRPTGLNRYFVLCTTEALAFGGGGHFALHIDAELLNGSSGACETYGNCCLAQTEEFILKDVELWGFVHTSRYTPSYALFKEPEEVPSFRSC